MNDTSPERDFAYERVAYPTFILDGLTPDRLASAAMLHRWRAPEPTTATMLEIGCAEGVNLIGAAAANPRGRFVGFDLSPSAIERGRDLAAAAGLTNVDLHYGDATTYPLEGETFDYVVCHGLLSWVPQPVREAVIRLMGARLAPGGIGYMSFDCLPGAGAKASIAEFLRREVTEKDDPVEAMRQSVKAVALMRRSQRSYSYLTGQLDSLIKDLPRHEPAYFFHDWLAEHYKPVELSQFISAAAGSNLKIAGSASNYDLFPHNLDEEARALLDRCGEDHGQRLMTLDYLHGGHIFHRDLLVRIEGAPAAAPDAMTELSYAYEGGREEIETDAGPAVKYAVTPELMTATTNPDTKLVLDCLYDAGSNEVAYGEIMSRTGVSHADLRDILKGLCTFGLITAHATPQPWVLHPGERPLAGHLLRTMVTLGERVVTLRGTGLDIDQAETQYCLVLCDGTRTREEITAIMSEAFGKPIPLEKVKAAIDHFARKRVFAS